VTSLRFFGRAHSLYFALLLFVAWLPVGCGNMAAPSAPAVIAAAATTPTSPTPRPAEFPTVTRPARVFGHPEALARPLTAETQGSRFVLYDDGTFALQFLRFAGESRGTYQDSEGSVTFHWEGSNSAGPWEATGSNTGDRLTVRYNPLMVLTDFEDAVYVRE
jgi:hypothetical protein